MIFWENPDNMEANVTSLSTAIDAYPAAFNGNRLNLLFLNDAHPIFSSKEFLKKIDGLDLQDERREYLLGEKEGWPFPTINIANRPDPWKVTDALFENFEIAGIVLLFLRAAISILAISSVFCAFRVMK